MSCKMSLRQRLVRVSLALAAAVAAAPAFAADLPAAPPLVKAPVAYTPPPYDWSGIYFGLNGGYGFGDSQWTLPAGNSGHFDLDGGLFGATLGFNFQAGHFVFGLEGDLDWTDIEGSASSATLCPAGGSCTFKTENDWLGTARGRFGYAFDRVMVYGTAGGAFGNVKPELTTPPLVGSSNSTQAGWTAGGGVEYALSANFTARIEYLFVDLSRGNFSCGPAQCPIPTTIAASFDASLVRVGLDYKFGGL